MCTLTCTCSFRKLESFVVAMETQVPRSHHLPTSPILLYPSWQSVNFGALATRSQGARDKWKKPGRRGREAGWGRRWEQTGFRWRGGEPLWDAHATSPLLCGFFALPPSPLVNVEVAAVFSHHRLWSASSVPGGGAHINNALGSTNTCTQYPQGTPSPKWTA